MRTLAQVGWVACASLFAATAQASSIVDAAERQGWADVRAQARRAADFDAPQADGTTALLWAVHHDNLEIASLLLERGANPNVRNRYGITPLSEAAVNANAAMIERLLAAGADADAALAGDDTPLMLAARSGSVAAVKALLAHGARVDARDGWHGETALMWAAGENHPEVVRVLVAAGADINAKSTVFDWKAMGVKQGGVMSALGFGGLTALMHAARQNSYDAAIALLELGADPNLKNPEGVSTLRIAAANGHLDLTHALIEHGADPKEGGLVEVVKVGALSMMRAATNRPNRLSVYEVTQALLARGAPADSLPAVYLPKKDAFSGGGQGGPGAAPSETALYYAAQSGDLKLMQLLLEHGADVNHATARGVTPLMAAMEFIQRRPQAQGPTDPAKRPPANRIAAARMLLERGADINAADANGMTALHWMADQGADELVQFLASAGARLDLKDSSNRTALDIANGVAQVPRPGPGGLSELESVSHESTVVLLRKLMADAGVKETPYTVPAPAQAAPAVAKVAGE